MLDNLLNIAMGVTGNQKVTYSAYTGRVTNAYGVDVATYATGVETDASVQPVPRDVYQVLGLDFRKFYFDVYISKDVIGVKRDVSGDKIEYNGETFQCMSITDWYAQNGWVTVLCVRIDEGS